MKPTQLFLTVFLISLSACQHSKDYVVIQGEIIGDIPEKVEYTNPVHGICNWWFTNSVQPDSMGRFQVIIPSEDVVFIKMRTSYKDKGTLIAEPGKTYTVRFDLTDKENPFTVTGKNDKVQKVYAKLPDPGHIQTGAREFLRDSAARKIKNTIEQRRLAEIAEFEKLLADKTISREVFDLVKTDRNCYYDALLATIAWIKDLMVIQGIEKIFTKDFENLWKGAFQQPLLSNPSMVKSPWFPFYAESYIYFQEYETGNFTKEKLEAISEGGKIKSYRVSEAKKYLPPSICEDYLANYLYEESAQKEYDSELIGLFDDFKTEYPRSNYIPYISPLINEIIEFQKTTNSDFSEKIKFVNAYQELNSLTEIANTFPEGKIYVDVWATWCGPCKVEFKHKEALKPLLQKNDIRMLYISIDRDQDSIQWKNMIKFYDLEGFHVRANKKLNADLRKIFDKNGAMSIPWYILMDSEGNILKRHTRRPSQITELEKEINSIP